MSVEYIESSYFKLFLEILTLIYDIVFHIFVAFKQTVYPSRKVLKNEIVLITGGAGGIGSLLAKSLYEKGCTVIIWDIVNSEQRAQQIRESSTTVRQNKIYGFQIDITKYDTVLKEQAYISDNIGEVSILINNAGVVCGKYLLEENEQQIRKTFEVNTLANFWTCKAFLPAMLKKNQGHIVTIASSAGLAGTPKLSSYCSSKFAALGFAESLRHELGKIGASNIDTTCVLPYMIDTGMFQGAAAKFPRFMPFLKPEDVSDQIIDAIERNIPVLCIPFTIHINYIMRAILPTRAVDAVGKFLGVDSAMDNLKAHTGPTLKK